MSDKSSLRKKLRNVLTPNGPRPVAADASPPPEPQNEPGDAVALKESPGKLLREIRDIVQLSRGTDSYHDAGDVIAFSSVAGADTEWRQDFIGEFPYILVPAQPRTLQLYAGESIYPFLIVPSNTPMTAVYPRLRGLRIVALATANADAVLVYLSSREYKLSPESLGGAFTPSDTQANPSNVSGAESFMMGWDASNNVWRRVQVASGSGTLDVAIGNVGQADGAANIVAAFSSQGIARPLAVAGMVYNGSTTDRLRTPIIFKTVSATASGATALWTPAAGKKFRLMRLLVEITENAQAAVAAVKTIDFLDSATSINITLSHFIPSAAATVFAGGYTTGWIDLGNGILSAAANNVLNVSLSTALTAGEVRVIACGTEE